MTAASVAADKNILPAKEIIYKTTKSETVRVDEDDDYYEDELLEEDAMKFGREK